MPVHWDWLVSTQCVPEGTPQTMALGGKQHAPRQTTVAQEVAVVWTVPPTSAHADGLLMTHEPLARQQGLLTGGQGLGVQVVLTMFTHGPKQKA